MQNKNNIKAYTLMEMIVVMIISAIIVSMAYVVFSKVNLLSLNVRKLYQANYELILFDQLVYVDMEGATKIIKTPEGFRCESTSGTREYKIAEQVLRIQGTKVDTFSFFKDMEWSYDYATEKNSLVNGVRLRALYDDEEIRFFYVKEYGADVLVNEYE